MSVKPSIMNHQRNKNYPGPKNTATQPTSQGSARLPLHVPIKIAVQIHLKKRVAPLLFIFLYLISLTISTRGQTITTIAGTANPGDYLAAGAASLFNPRGMTVDATGNIYIAEQGHHRVRRINAATGVITTIAGTGTAGYSGDGAPAHSAQLNNPFSVAV
ncbi:hypothetical protein I6F37_38165, partial [Bradyrhizobium sp. NBAIM08]|nr:hypothetical protein [Bradyrhizobium sp. NBAIM08]